MLNETNIELYRLVIADAPYVIAAYAVLWIALGRLHHDGAAQAHAPREGDGGPRGERRLAGAVRPSSVAS